MIKYRFNIRLLIIPGVILLIIISLQSYIEYQSSRNIISKSFDNMAISLISATAKAAEKGMIAYQSRQHQATEQLNVIIESIGALYQKNALDKDFISKTVARNNLAILEIFDSNGNKNLKLLTENPVKAKYDKIRNYLKPIFNGEKSKINLGFTSDIGDSTIFAVAGRLDDGGAVLAGIPAYGLFVMRQTYGIGSVIEDIRRNEEIKYAFILHDGQIMAATHSYTIDAADDWYNRNLPENDYVTRIKLDSTNTGVNHALEAMGSFYVAGQHYGNIVIGVNTASYEYLTSNLKRNIFLQAAFTLLLILIAVAGINYRQNLKTISAQYEEIKKEVRKLEEDRALKDKLMAMGELAGGVAHEVRNPLNAIKVIIQRLKREFEPANDIDEYNKLTGLVQNEVDRINSTVEEFLNLTKPPVLSREKGNLNKCIEKAVSLFKARADNKNTKLLENLTPIPDILIDMNMCHQAVLNLLENALTAIEKNGVIEIKTYYTNNKCYLEIGDSGPGIPDDLKSRIFDLYFTTRPDGNGMGLPTVLRIIKEHNGIIEVSQSSLGGALFKMEFPVEKG